MEEHHLDAGQAFNAIFEILLEPFTFTARTLLLKVLGWGALLAAVTIAAPPTKRQALLYPTDNVSHHLPIYGDPVEYPGEDTQDPIYSSPAPCSNVKFDSFCEDVPLYPVNDVRNALGQTPPEMKEVFTNVGLHGRTKITVDDLDEERICRPRFRVFFPKAAKDLENHWRIIVNDLEYKQTVVAEICDAENEPCSYVENSLPIGYNSRCRQMYSHQKLLALDKDNKIVTIDSFKFPSCCVCFVKYPRILIRSKDLV